MLIYKLQTNNKTIETLSKQIRLNLENNLASDIMLHKHILGLGRIASRYRTIR